MEVVCCERRGYVVRCRVEVVRCVVEGVRRASSIKISIGVVDVGVVNVVMGDGVGSKRSDVGHAR